MKKQIKTMKRRCVFVPKQAYIQSVIIAIALAGGPATQHGLSAECGSSCPSTPPTDAPPRIRETVAGKQIDTHKNGRAPGPLGGEIQLQFAAVSDPVALSAPSEVVNGIIHVYSPADICAAYGVGALHNEGWTGQGQTIVVVDPYGSPTALQDLQAFSAYYRLSAPDLTIIYVNGAPTYNATALGSYEQTQTLETSLDLQWAHVIAPDAKLVLLVTNPGETEGVQGFPSILQGIKSAILQYPGSAISKSFAATEQTFAAAGPTLLHQFETVYQQADAAGCTPLAASGDWGSANPVKQSLGAKSSDFYPYPTVCWPASSPSVTAVGGTWLQYHWRWDPQATLAAVLALGDPHPFASGEPVAFAYMSWDSSDDRTEAVWREDWRVFPNDGSGNATGGGLSSIFPTPSWQASLPSSLTRGARALPDVSWNAAINGSVWVLDSIAGGWMHVGGTSASTPQIAGLVGLVNQMRASLGKGPIGHLAPKLYQLPATDFNDIVPQTFGIGANVVTIGDNFLYGSTAPGLLCTVGYDLTTGLGSPKAYSSVHDLAILFP
jgi:subtilase family serine protease